MNDLTLYEILTPEDDAFYAGQAEAIRLLAKRTFSNIVEIGERLIAVKERPNGHGRWLPWLEREFGWSHDTARNYMAVAEAFKLRTVRNLERIDASALYLLAREDVPEAARQEAIERAEAGERITKAEAEQMVAKAMQETTDKLRDHILELERAESTRVKEAVKAVEAQFADDKKALKAELKQIRKNVFADPKTLEKALTEMLGVKKLQPKHWKAVAEATGRQVIINKKVYEPYTDAERVESDERIRQTSAITRALETLAAAPSPQALRPMVFEAQLGLHREVAGKVAAWLAEYAALLREQ